MAEKVGEIYYDVTLETGQMVDGSRRVQREADKLEASFTRVAAAVASFASAMAIAGVMRDAVNAARAYEKTLADLSAITGVAGEGLVRLSDEAKALARSTTASSGQVVEAMKLIASAKPELLETAGALTAVTKEAIALSEASGMQLPAAAEAVTLALNQFGVSADQASRFVNVLAAGAKFGASEISDTAIALKNSAVSAAAAGVSFEEANAALQALAAGGIKGGEAGTALRNVLLKLENEADTKLKPSVVGLAGALEALGAKSLSSSALTKMFGLENVNAAQALIGSAAAVKSLTLQLTGTNTAYEQAATQTGTFDAAVKRMNSALEMAGQVIGTQFLPFLRQGAEAVQSLANSLSTGSDVMGKAMTVLEVSSALLAGMLAVRLVTSIRAVIVAYTANAVAANAANAAALMLTGTTASLTTAQTALAVASGTAASAGRAFGAVMAGLGGPIGLAVAALVMIAWNWDAITGKANDAAATSERAAARIASALKKSGDAATKDLQEQLAETQKAMALIDRELSMPRQLQSGRGMGGGRTLTDQRIADLKEKRDALVKIADDIQRAMFRAAASDEGGGMVGPADTSPKKPKKASGPDSEVIAKRLAAQSYYQGLLADTREGFAKLAEEEKKAYADNAKRALEDTANADIYAKAKIAIQQKYAKERADLEQKQVDDTVAFFEKEAQAEEARNQRLAEQTKMARDILVADDPIARLQLELQAKSDLLTQYAKMDQANANTYLAARVEAERQTAAQILALQMAGQQAGYAAAQSAAGDILGVLQQAGKDRTALGKAVFLAEKAMAVATIIMNTEMGAAKAIGVAGPFGIPLASIIRAAGYTSAATVAGLAVANAFGGGRALGGPVSAGSLYRVNETGAPEMYTGAGGKQYMLPTQAGKVTAADQIGGTPQWTVVINNAPPGTTASVDNEQRIISVAVARAEANFVEQISSNTGVQWSALRGSSNVTGRL